MLRKTTLVAVTAVVLASCVWLANAQQPSTAAVPITGEQHHHLIFQNDYVRVFNVIVPAGDATLLHRHNFPYLYLSLGPANFANAVEGQPEARVSLQDNDTRYSAGHMSHLVRMDKGLPFHNITIELLRPQENLVNIGAEVAPNVPKRSADALSADTSGEAALTHLFATSELQLGLVELRAGVPYVEANAKHPALLIVRNGANVLSKVASNPPKTLRPGEVEWLPSAAKRSLTATADASVLVVSFLD